MDSRAPRLLSFVIPLYNEERSVPHLRGALDALSVKLECRCEWILVDDGSTDDTGRLLFAWAADDRRAKVIELSRNFGQQAALTAGIDQASGDALILMDGDLQDPPELVRAMLEKHAQGYDVVYARRTRREGESLGKRVTARIFYGAMRLFVQRELPENVGDFRLISADVAEALRGLRESNRFMRGLTAWLGYTQTSIPFDRPARREGSSKYGLLKMSRLAADAVAAFSGMPARLGTWAGLGFVVAALTVAGRRPKESGLFAPSPTPTDPLPWILGCTAAVLFCVGLVGGYVARVFDEIKGRPIYVIRRTANLVVKRYPRMVAPAGGDGPKRERAA